VDVGLDPGPVRGPALVPDGLDPGPAAPDSVGATVGTMFGRDSLYMVASSLNLLAEVFPEREVIGIHSVDLIWGLGALHCMTQQQPAAGSSAGI